MLPQVHIHTGRLCSCMREGESVCLILISNMTFFQKHSNQRLTEARTCVILWRPSSQNVTYYLNANSSMSVLNKENVAKLELDDLFFLLKDKISMSLENHSFPLLQATRSLKATCCCCCCCCREFCQRKENVLKGTSKFISITPIFCS